MPTVSVIIPNYNHARFLDKRIQSVLNQTYQDFEIIYLDDASTDNSAKVFAPYSYDERIRSITNSVNGGSPFKQWNKGMGAAQGEYIWIAESDDYADEHFLEKLVAKLAEHPAAGLAYCQSVLVDEQGSQQSTLNWWTKELHPTRWEHDFCNNGRDECQRYLAQKNTIPNASAVVFRKQAYLEAGGPDEGMKVCGDWTCWAGFLLISDVVYIAKPLNFFRKHKNSVGYHTEANGILFAESYQALQFLKQRCTIGRSTLCDANRRIRADWLHAMLQKPSPISWRRNLQIYWNASQVDHHIHFHLLRRGLRGIFRRYFKI